MATPADKAPRARSRKTQPREHALFEQALASQLSHDLLTPLTVILGYAELLQLANPRDDQREGLDALMRAGANLGDVIERLIQHARAAVTGAPAEAITAILPGLSAVTEPGAVVADLTGRRRTLGSRPDGAPLANKILRLGLPWRQASKQPEALDEPLLVAMVERQRAALAGLQKAADTDHLTGIGNRRAIDHRLEAEWRRAHRHGRPLSVLMVDIDELKTINDAHGHLTGDFVIAEVARRLASAIRIEDQVARIGGDEYMIVCPETDAASARAIVRKLSRAVAMPMDLPGSANCIEVSIGWASTSAAVASRESLVAAADARLYRAKRRHSRREVTTPQM